MDKLRKDIVTIFKSIQTNTEYYCYSYYDNMWVNVSINLEDYFENPLVPTDIELTLFKIHFGQILFSYRDERPVVNWRQIIINE